MDTDKIYAESLIEEYSPKNTPKVIALKKLDKRAKRVPNIFAFSFGIIGTLIFGVGMCLSMQAISAPFGNSMVIGVIIGLVGMLMAGINYPIYKKISEKSKQKYAFEIVQLAREISEADNDCTTLAK